MKIIGILGSPRGTKHYTGTLLTEVLNSAKDSGAETEVFLLNDDTIKTCKGCLEICHTKGGKCHQEDNFPIMEKAMLEADGIILATPNYIFNVSAHMKAFLDRCAFLIHCQQLNGKYAASIVTSGGSDPEVVERYLEDVSLHCFGFRYVGSVSAVELQLTEPEERKSVMKSASQLGIRIANAIKNKETFPEQEEEISQTYEIYKYMTMMLKERWPSAWEYWNSI
ncbi:MAG: iron-sulfur protein [Candidatus Schekmanbacteria bacterium]|nr:MAG: iron-sulfur protein [Candidatus Schekmanbacteria bacterium]